MMKNPQIGNSERKLIDKAVHRLIADLKGVEPPLDLEHVRDRLKLDREYYSSKDPSLMREVIHSLKIAGREMVSSSTMVGRMIDKLGLRAMVFWDQNRILIDQELHRIKHRWAEGHEIGHKLLFWHKHYLLGDSKNELSPTCHAIIEAEANYAAGQLLFMQKRFVDEARSTPLSLESLKVLAQRFGNSNVSTLWRLVEECAGSTPIVGIVSEHPHRLSEGFDHSTPCRYVIESPSFRTQFSKTSELRLFQVLTDVCNRKTGGPLGSKEVELVDNNSSRHEFMFESFCYRFKQSDGDSGYQVLTLGIHQRKLSRVVVG
jgi:Zn-dependent peptidase ImmA (M78 family)